MKRRKANTVTLGTVKIGSRFPIRIQSMTKTDTRNVKKTVTEIKKLEKAGCEIIRVAVKDSESAKAIKKIKRKINIPLVADIHFDYRLALEAIKNGADKIRINPGNISNPNELKKIIQAAKKRKIPIRIGLNSGSLPKTKSLVPTAIKCIKFFEKEKFHDIIVSLKSSDVEETVSAYKKLAVFCSYPFHLGITAAGSHDTGVVKSSVGIGSLLLAGIGDTVRVSLTGEPIQEVIAAKRILQSLKLRSFGPDIISCPTCGRCQVDLVGIVRKIEKKLQHTKRKPVTIAIMGCEVNGPGEAKAADIGIAFGKYTGLLFKNGKVIKKVKAKSAAKEIVKALK